MFDTRVSQCFQMHPIDFVMLELRFLYLSVVELSLLKHNRDIFSHRLSSRSRYQSPVQPKNKRLYTIQPSTIAQTSFSISTPTLKLTTEDMAHPQKSTFLRSTRRILSAPPYRIRPHQHRSLHNTPCRPNQPLSANTATTATNSNRDPPAATSTSAAQPFSTPLYPSPETTGVSSKSASPQSTKNKPKIVSSVPAGTPLKGLNYFKNKTDPVAMVDEEYPDWLWTVLDEPSREGHSAADETGSKDPRLFCKHSSLLPNEDVISAGS